MAHNGSLKRLDPFPRYIFFLLNILAPRVSSTKHFEIQVDLSCYVHVDNKAELSSIMWIDFCGIGFLYLQPWNFKA